MQDASLAARLIQTALQNQVNVELLRRLPTLGLTDCWLVAGCIFQALWNAQADRDAAAGVKDYDIFYFDSADLSYEAEDSAIGRVRAAIADLGITFDLKNQARVHLWYRQRFGHPYPRLTSAQDGIKRFLIAGSCIGVAPRATGHEVYAPYGLTDAFDGILRPNPLTREPASFRAKAESYRARWPHLRIIDA